MPALKEKGISLLGSAVVDMKTAASTTLFTTPVGKVARIIYVVVRDQTASMAGGTNYSFTNWLQNVDLSALTTANTQYIVLCSEVMNGLLGAKTLNFGAGSGTQTIYTTPAGTITRLSGIMIKDTSASLAAGGGGTSYNFGTAFRNAGVIDLSSMTTANTDYIWLDQNNIKSTEVAGSTAIQMVVTTGTVSGAPTARVEVYGVQEPISAFTELAASTAFQITVTTGSTAACNATLDVFGYLT